MERYKLEWVVTSSSPVVQFKAEWKMVGKAGEWQTEIVEVTKIGCSASALLFWAFPTLAYLFLGTLFLNTPSHFIDTFFMGILFSESAFLGTFPS